MDMHEILAHRIKTMPLNSETERLALITLDHLSPESLAFINGVLNTNHEYLPKLLVQLGKKMGLF